MSEGEQKETSNAIRIPLKCQLPAEARLPEVRVLVQKLSVFHCYSCQLNFLSMEEYKSHMNKEHHFVDFDEGKSSSKAKKVSTEHCDQCRKVFDNVVDLREHVICDHEESNIFQCSFCPKSFCHKQNLSSHLKKGECSSNSIKSEPFDDFECEQCPKRFWDPLVLQDHVVYVHAEVKKYQCQICKSRFGFKQSLLRHNRYPCNNFYNGFEPEIFVCERCQKTFKSFQNLEDHIKSVHENVKSHKCHYCDKSFGFKESLDTHLQYVHENEEAGEDDYNQLQTSMMIKLEEDSSTLQNVEEIYFEGINNDDDDYFPNDEDVLSDDDFIPDNDSDWEEKSVVRSSRRNGHINKVSSNVETLESSLANDESRSKRKVKTISCDRCDKTYSSKQELIDHVNFTHENVLAYQCDICSTKFGLLTSYHRHMRRSHKIENKAKIKKRPPVKKPGLKCNNCNKSFCSNQNLQDHVNFVHENMTLYQCDVCDAKFGFKMLLDRHTEILHPADGLTKEGETIQCDECNKVFFLIQTFEDHFLFIHNRVMAHQCTTCSERFGYLNSLQNHLNIGTHERKPKQFKCNLCEKTFSYGQTLTDHVQFDHNGIMCHQCRRCGKQFGFKTARRRHMKSCKSKVPSDPSIRKCQRCPETFTSLVEYVLHRKTHKTKMSNKPKNHQCEHCAKLFATNQALESHVKIVHEGEKPLKCSHCDMSFAYKIKLSQHIATEHLPPEASQFVCDSCSKVFSSRSRLMAHINHVHIKTYTFECELCHKKFKDSSHVKRHKDTVHLKKRSFECEICHKKLTNTKMSVHMKWAHSTDRPFKCDKCPKAFVDGSMLKRHIVHVHEQVKSIECELCGKKFPQLQNLKKHISGVHEKLKPFQCDLCGGYFAQTSSLYLHKKKVHSIRDPAKHKYHIVGKEVKDESD